MLMGTVTLAFTAFIYYLFPLITGRMYNEKQAQIHFILAFVGIILVFITQHILGLYGMPRRVFDYLPLPPYIIMNQIATIGAWIVGPSYLLMVINLVKSAGSGKLARIGDPFRIGEEYYDYARRSPIIRTSSKRMAQGLAIVVIVMAVGFAIAIPNWHNMAKIHRQYQQLRLNPVPEGGAATSAGGGGSWLSAGAASSESRRRCYDYIHSTRCICSRKSGF